MRRAGLDHWVALMDEPGEDVVELARAAERLGYRGVALPDHVAVPERFDSQHPSGHCPFDHRSDFPDALITAAAILAATERLEVMTYVYVLPMREPFSVAKQAATISVLSGGRFRLGVGAGWLMEEIELLGQPLRRRGRRMDEMLEIIRALWTRESVEHHGEFFDFGPVGMAPRPRQPLPIWVGGKSRAALERAARHDGWLGMNYDLPEVLALLEQLDAARASSPGGRRDDFEVFVIPNAPASPDLHDELAGRGVTATMAPLWELFGEAPLPLAARHDALARYAGDFIAR